MTSEVPSLRIGPAPALHLTELNSWDNMRRDNEAGVLVSTRQS